MPIHDWTRVPSGLFHDFHQSWSIRIKDALNAADCPKGLRHWSNSAPVPSEADVLAIETRGLSARPESGTDGGVATLDGPVTRIMRRSTKEIYSGRANRIVVRHHLSRIVAVIEVLSPGNKDSRSALRNFIEKTIDFLRKGVHVLVVDLFPPTPRDPFGIHKAIWDEIEEEPFAFPPGKDRTLASYETIRGEHRAYVEPVAVGDALPDMPLFLAYELHVMVPLGPTYRATWEASPEEMRRAVETGVMPDAEEP